MELPLLDQVGIAEVLRSMGGPLAELAKQVNTVGKLYRLSGGDPLLVRSYVDSLRQMGDRVALGIEQVVKKQLLLTMASSQESQSMINAMGLHPNDTAGIVQHDWDEAPDVPVLFGRTKELITLERWITVDRCRLVAIVGMKGIGKTRLLVRLGRGGIGKTDLSLKLARGIQERFDYVIWRRLLNAPKVSEILTDLVKFLSNQQEVTMPDTVSEQISRLLHYFRWCNDGVP